MGTSEYKSMMGLPAPGKSMGDFPVARSNEIQGGLRTISNEAEMTQIPPWLRQEGMEVWVTSTKRKYRLNNNPKTRSTVLLDWTYINDGLTAEDKEKIITSDKWRQELNTLYTKLSQQYVTKQELEQNYLTAASLIGYFQTVQGMQEYVTTEMLERLAVALSKSVSRVVPPEIIRVKQGTIDIDLPLPTSVIVTFSDGQNYVAPVSWNTLNYDAELVGYQVIPGRMILPEFVVAVDDVPNIAQTQVVVQVIGKKEEIVEEVTYNDVAGFENPMPIEVDVGTELFQLDLPSTVNTKLVTPEGEVIYEHLQVTWDTSVLESTGGIMSGQAVYGEVSLETRSDATVRLSNTLKLQPIQPIKVRLTTIAPTYQYKRGFTLKAGKYEVESDIINRIDHVTTEMLYGVDNDPSQRQVEVRFMGILDSSGNNKTPEIIARYPDGIRMPVLTSNKADVEAFIDTIKSFNEELGYKLEFEIPGGTSDPRILLDDEKHLLSFGSAVLHNCLFLIRRSKTVNLPYPDIC